MYYYDYSYIIQTPDVPLVIFPASLNQPSLLILSLRSASPVRCLIYSVFFLLISFLFRLVDGLRGVLGWRIDRVENLRSLAFITGQRDCGEATYERRGPSIHKLMLSTRRHNHKVSGFDILVFSGYCSFARSGCECQSLVDGVDLGLSELFPSNWHSWLRQNPG